MLINRKKQGFTLVEIMVAVSIFSVVALIATSALINANRLSQKAQATKLVMDNLNFALDSMLFKIRRSGQIFNCSNTISFPGAGTARSCPNGEGESVLALTNLENSNADLYFLETGRLKYSNNASGQSHVPLTASAITISSLVFKVYNAGDAGNQNGWPRVEILLVGSAQVGHETTNFELRTTATARQ